MAAASGGSFLLQVAADLPHGGKENLLLYFPQRPSLAALRKATEEAYTKEAQRIQPGAAEFAVEQLLIHDPVRGAWGPLLCAKQLAHGMQVFAFRPRDAAGIEEAPGPIPAARPPLEEWSSFAAQRPARPGRRPRESLREPPPNHPLRQRRPAAAAVRQSPRGGAPVPGGEARRPAWMPTGKVRPQPQQQAKRTLTPRAAAKGPPRSGAATAAPRRHKPASPRQSPAQPRLTAGSPRAAPTPPAVPTSVPAADSPRSSPQRGGPAQAAAAADVEAAAGAAAAGAAAARAAAATALAPRAPPLASPAPPASLAAAVGQPRPWPVQSPSNPIAPPPPPPPPHQGACVAAAGRPVVISPHGRNAIPAARRADPEAPLLLPLQVTEPSPLPLRTGLLGLQDALPTRTASRSSSPRRHPGCPPAMHAGEWHVAAGIRWNPNLLSPAVALPAG
eukprot:TRINITY_DN15542_c0_g1_i3.p1 TRINITY_DN15542_c0_g1~~TRINITY_DN15542_c0_g1_i3.p1  ORF type:complete len:471 (+),score=63.40 TRINITY_DN15542_c0_g1_i3:73-1413(+)